MSWVMSWQSWLSECHDYKLIVLRSSMWLILFRCIHRVIAIYWLNKISETQSCVCISGVASLLFIMTPPRGLFSLSAHGLSEQVILIWAKRNRSKATWIWILQFCTKAGFSLLLILLELYWVSRDFVNLPVAPSNCISSSAFIGLWQ